MTHNFIPTKNVKVVGLDALQGWPISKPFNRDVFNKKFFPIDAS